MNIVFIVMEYRSCDEHYNLGVFSTKDKATQYLKDNKWLGVEGFEIETYELDKELKHITKEG